MTFRPRKVRCRVPLQRRWSVLMDSGDGALFEVAIAWAPRSTWMQRRDLAKWGLLRVGPFCLGIRVVGGQNVGNLTDRHDSRV